MIEELVALHGKDWVLVSLGGFLQERHPEVLKEMLNELDEQRKASRMPGGN